MRDLAISYRPQTLEELTGQGVVKQLLAPRLEAGEPPQAVLFSGPRGVGKTTTSQIFAMGLNCEERGPTANPCGECRSYRAIRHGRSEWVRTLNAGSDGGVDVIRDLLAELRSPVPDGVWRVITIDEGHGLTQTAQTALLQLPECTRASESSNPSRQMVSHSPSFSRQHAMARVRGATQKNAEMTDSSRCVGSRLVQGPAFHI